jgi:hypothetical protein
MADRYYGPVSTHRVTVGEEGLHLAAKNLILKHFYKILKKFIYYTFISATARIFISANEILTVPCANCISNETAG